MKAILAFFAAIIVATTFSTSARSDDASDWAADKARLEQLANEGRCEGYWDVLWPWAKKGNDEARELLLVSLLPGPHMEGVCSPGSQCDFVTHMRDIIIVAVHASPIQYKEYKEAVNSYFQQWGFEDVKQGKEFMECFNNTTSDKDCASLAVGANIVPSFEEYAAQIDAMLADGLKSKCLTVKDKH